MPLIFELRKPGPESRVGILGCGWALIHDFIHDIFDLHFSWTSAFKEGRMQVSSHSLFGFWKNL